MMLCIILVLQELHIITKLVIKVRGHTRSKAFLRRLDSSFTEYEFKVVSKALRYQHK